jgi:cyd operon protein YbgT
MWYFAWILGVGFAVLLAVLNAMWGESEEGRVTENLPGAASGKPNTSATRS